MVFLTALIVFPVFVYSAVLMVFRTGLGKQRPERSGDSPKVTVLIAARNEDRNIAKVLGDLRNQTYPSDRVEILIADDHSRDKTAEIVRSCSVQDSRIRLIPVTVIEPGLTAKKNALTQALKHATGEIILTTDADCRVLPTWVETMVSYFTGDVGLVVGYSQFTEAGSLFEKLQTVDFLMLMAAAQGTANLGWAWAASGQNFAYRKTVYDQVDGYSQIGHRISGDDVLFLQLVRKTTRWKVRFAASPDAYNRTKAEPTLAALINQRKRWASNGAYQWKLNKSFFLYVIITFLANLILLLSLPAGFLWPMSLPYCIGAWILKFLAEGSLFLRACRLYGRKDLYKTFPAWFLTQIPYVVFVGIAGTLGGFRWKERNHTSPEQT